MCWPIPRAFPTSTTSLHNVFQDTADALAFLHHTNPAIYHRDLKPDNIMLTVDFKVKLVDFGVIKVLRNTYMTHNAGGVNRLVGTSHFMVGRDFSSLARFDAYSRLPSCTKTAKTSVKPTSSRLAW
jgi:serine/threonine protein kinase